MQINWYPGHMTKSMRMIESNLKLVDAVVYVLDARAPASCMNPAFERLIGGMPRVYALNKADLASESETKLWTDKLSGAGSAAVALTSTASKQTSELAARLKKMCEGKIEKYRAKGVRTSVRAMVLGVPNCGKSTLINNLCGSGKTETGNRAGVTRGKQWVRVGEYLEVLDTPGTLYPKLTDQRVARRLAYVGSIRDEVTDTAELALSLIGELAAVAPGCLSERYLITEGGDAYETLTAIAGSRGMLLRGGEPDTDKGAAALIDDFRKGRLGRITLDKAADYRV